MSPGLIGSQQASGCRGRRGANSAAGCVGCLAVAGWAEDAAGAIAAPVVATIGTNEQVESTTVALDRAVARRLYPGPLACLELKS